MSSSNLSYNARKHKERKEGQTFLYHIDFRWSVKDSDIKVSPPLLCQQSMYGITYLT